MSPRALGVAVGLLADRAVGEPPTIWHPVAWFGTGMQRLEQLLYADSRARGVLHAGLGAGTGLVAGALLTGAGRLTTGRPRLGAALATGVAVAIASSGRMLRGTSAEIEQLLREDDIGAARERVSWLVGRDPSALDGSGIAAAVVESLAENTVDAVVAPAFWALVGGAPGVLAHRAVNTMDAMVGHHSERYERFGWASARLDDVMAWVPARMVGGTVAAISAMAPGTPAASRVLRVVRRDAPSHPSPNAGVAESAVAAALGVSLGGPLRYGPRHEDRPVLGDGPRPTVEAITRARRLVDAVEWVLTAGALAGGLAARRLTPVAHRRGPEPETPR